MADGEEQGQPGGGPDIPAGWYPDPNTGGQRYWDGSQWTEYTDQNYPSQPAGTPAAAPAAPGQGTAPAGPGPATNQKAVWSLVTGILSIICCIFFFGVIALALGGTAVFLGRAAKREIAASGQAGQGMAQAGMICGFVGIALGLIGLVLSIILVSIGEFDLFFDFESFENFES